LAGTLPSELAVLPLLNSIELPYNHFTGTLPSEWGEMNHLDYIEVHNNTLTGTIPDTWWGDHMTGLNFGNNELSGSIPGDRLGGMLLLRSFFLDYNSFTGSIPTEVGLLTNLGKLIDNDMTCVSISCHYPGSINSLNTYLFLFYSQNSLGQQRHYWYLANRAWSAHEVERVMAQSPCP
jgi:hypothetical protein